MIKTLSPKKRLRSIALYSLALFLGIVLWGFVFAWKKVPEYMPVKNVTLSVPIMSNDDYQKIVDTHPRPYIIQIETENGGGIFFYGAEHTKDPNDPQIQEIKDYWVQFKPSVALVESRLGIMFPGLMDPVQTFSEPGIVHALAREDGIPTYTWEPPIEVEMASLLKQPFSQEQIALRVILGPSFSARRFGTAEDSVVIVEESINKRKDWPGIENVFTGIEDVDIAWEKYFPNGPDWRDVSDEYGLPGFLGEIETNLARDEHLVQVVIDLVNRGERVFVIAGLSHAVKIDPPLMGYFEK